MPVIWDTTLVSRVRPGSSALSYFEAKASSAERVLIPATSVMEVSWGYSHLDLSRPAGSKFLYWFGSFIARPEVAVLPFARAAAVAAGRVRARAPFPARAHKRDRRSKADRRVAWAFDMQIAATAWAFGVPVATENVADFTRLAAVLAELYPRAKPLEVLPSPL